MIPVLAVRGRVEGGADGIGGAAVGGAAAAVVLVLGAVVEGSLVGGIVLVGGGVVLVVAGGAEVVVVGLRDGVTDADAWAAAIDDDTAAVFLANPNFYGAVEDVAALTAVKGEAVAVAFHDPLAHGSPVPPGGCGGAATRWTASPPANAWCWS